LTSRRRSTAAVRRRFAATGGANPLPVKRRIAKRRISTEAELKAWDMMFSCGYDFFSSLEDLGYRNEAEARAAAPEAWKRLGRAFLAEYDDSGERAIHGVPWAEEQFGVPG
jgi:hypothetical protein